MKVTLISPYENVTVNGIRMLSAVLKAMGVECQMVMLPHEIKGVGSRGAEFRFSYPETALDQVAEVVQGSDLVGISLMSNYFDNAAQITQHLRRSIQAPIIWGGVNPTVRPEECLEHADLICVGEDEEALRELVQQMSNGNGRRPYRLALFSLTFYPGTELYERARREGLVTNEFTQVYRKFYYALKRTYINGLFQLFQSQYVPYWLIALLMSASLRCLNWVWLPEQVYRVCDLLGRVERGARRLLHGDWSPVRFVFRKTLGRAMARA